MQDRFKFRIPMFTDKGTFMDFQHLELGDFIECTLCGTNGEPQQCTGIKDKNGKLIYEGDIVIQREENAGPSKKLVIWEKDGGYLGLKYLKKSFFGVVTFHRFGYTYEVIGNIYENPELLEVSNDN